MREFITSLLKVVDPEKQKGSRYSQSRTYLLISFISYVGLLIAFLFVPIGIEKMELIADSLFVCILFFGSYSLTGKGFAYFHEYIKKRMK